MRRYVFRQLNIVAGTLIVLSGLIACSVPNLARDQSLASRLDQIPAPEAPAKDSPEYELYHFRWRPLLLQDAESRRILVSLDNVKTDIIPELRARGIKADAMTIELDGDPELGGQEFPFDLNALSRQRPYAVIPGGPFNRQQYVRVILKSQGKPVHVTDPPGVIEQSNFPKIDPAIYASRPEARMDLPDGFTKRIQFNPGMVPLAGKIQHRNVVWAVSPDSKNEELRRAFLEYGPDLVPAPTRDGAGRVTGWDVAIPANVHEAIKTLHAEPNDIFTKGGAAFNQHSYFWDDQFVAESLSNTDPKTAIDTLAYWISAQLPDGGIGRELDYKGKSFNRATDLKFGETRPNLAFFNPPIEGWAWHEVLRWSPDRAAPYLPRVIAMMRSQARWLVQNYGVANAHGDLVGFRWSNVGSGRDNAPRPLDENGMDALAKYGMHSEAAPGRAKYGLAVDLLAQYKTLLDHQREFSEILGKFDEAQNAEAESDRIGTLLNDRYYNRKLGWYVDLVPTGNDEWKQTDIVTLAGFWPIAAKAASREQVNAAIANYLENEDKFGGPLLPSISKDNPYYDEGGHYWRGGGWPPDWEMVARALLEYGLRDEAARLTERNLSAIAQASQGYAQGDSPQCMVQWVDAKPSSGSEADYNRVRARIADYFREFWSGHIKNCPPTDPEGTVFEFYGLRRDPKTDQPIATFGETTIPEDNRVHQTRTGFAGWGALVPLRSAHYLGGLDAVPAFRGDPGARDRWLYSLLTDPELAYHQVRYLPALRPLAEYVAGHRAAGFGGFRARLKALKDSDREARHQIEFLCQGYVELSPTFDPEAGKTAFLNYSYNGSSFGAHIDRAADGAIQLTVESPTKIRIQFNQQWSGVADESKGRDEPSRSSPIFELGGDQRTTTVQMAREALN